MKANKFYKRIFDQYFRKHICLVSLLITLVMLNVVFSSINPFLFGTLIDNLNRKDFNKTILFIMVYVILAFITSILEIVRGNLSMVLSYNISSDMKKALFNQYLRFETSTRDKYNTSELLNRLQNDSDLIVSFYLNVITNVLTIIINIIVPLIFIITISLQNTVVSLLNIPLVFILNILFKCRIEENEGKRRKYSDDLISFLFLHLDNFVHIKIFNMEEKTTLNYKKVLADGYDIEKDNRKTVNCMTILRSLISMIISFLTFYLFSKLIIDNKMTIGNMVSYSAYVSRLYEAVSKIMELNINTINVGISLGRIGQMMNESIEKVNNDMSIKDANNFIHRIKADHLSFSYNNSDFILKDISFNISKSGLSAIVGENGCGKTTLLKILFGLYHVDNGMFFINGLDINLLPIECIRKEIIYTTKETFIIDDTIKNNLKLANENATDKDIEQACRCSGLKSDFDLFDKKIDTILGTGGMQLSSGQKQKMNFARALLRKGSVYIFDEITSDLDGVAEKNIVEKIRELSVNNIVIFITHRTYPLIYSDNIFVLKDGRILHSGNHIELLKKSEYYKELFSLLRSNEQDG